MKKQPQKLSDEEISQTILEFLYSVRKKARSLASIAITITKIKKH